MKYIILLLISFNCFAQYKVEIKDKTDKVTHGAEFDSSLDAEIWIEKNKYQGVWGKLERVIPKKNASEEELLEAIETIPTTETEPEMIKLPQNFSYLIVDISEEKEKEQRLREALSDIKKGEMALATFRARNKEKNLNSQQKLQLFTNQNIMSILNALTAGSVDIALSLIQAYQADGVLVTEEDKSALIAELNK